MVIDFLRGARPGPGAVLLLLCAGGAGALGACRLASAPGPLALSASLDAWQESAGADEPAEPDEPDEPDGSGEPEEPADRAQPAGTEKPSGIEKEAAALEADARRAAADAIEAGEYERARAILAELLIDRYLVRARAELDAGRPEDGLVWVDRALDLSPRNSRALLLHGEGNWRLARNLIDSGASGVYVLGAFEDSLRSYQQAGDSPEALFGASRAAHALDRPEEALHYARQGQEQLAALDQVPGEDQLRAISEASYLAFIRARQAGAEEAVYRPLFDESEDATNRLLGRTPADPWVWNRLAYLYEWKQDWGAARTKLEDGLDRVPDDSLLLRHLVDVSRQEGGADAVIAAFEGFLERHPEIAEGWLTLGMERFERAMAAYESGELRPEEFRRAETELARCRALEPARTETCLGYEVVCRDAVGWCRFYEGDLEGAEAAFRSMEELFDGGIGWQLGDRLASGVTGLLAVVDGYKKRSDDYQGSPFAKPDWLARAAQVHDDLRELRPQGAAAEDAASLANDAGFLHRDAAVEIEWVGRMLCQAASGELTAPEARADLRERAGITAEPGSAEEAAAFRRAADASLARARDHMERSYSAYLEAARLAPEDVSILNDTALIAVYHLYRDLDRAQEMLNRAVQLGRKQLADPDLDPEERRRLENAWGDAHQNLGVLAFHHRDDPDSARRWFQMSVEIGPDPRPLLSEGYIPLIDAGPGAAPPGEIAGFLADFGHWAEPCGR